MPGHVEERITVNGCAISVMRGGAGPTVLYLHGASGRGGWLPFMDKLAQRFEVIAPEHPGFGTSDDPAWFDTMQDLAYFYLEFLRTQGLKDVHLVGLSLGGWLAAEIAVRNTARLKTLTLVDAAGIHVAGVPQIDTFMMSGEDRIRAFFFDKEKAEAMVARLFTPETERIAIKNSVATAKLSWQPRGHNPHLHKWLHLIDVPTLLVWGENDVLLPPAYAYAFQALIPGAKVTVFPECGHLPTVEKADDFVAALAAHFERSGS